MDPSTAISGMTPGSELEERVEPLPAEPSPPVGPGDRVSWDELDATIDARLSGGWYKAKNASGRPIVLRPGQFPYADVLAANPVAGSLACHVGPEGVALYDDYPPVKAPLTSSEAVILLTGLAQLVADLADGGLAMVDLDPRGLVRRTEGLGLARWPTIVAIGDPLPIRYREGITPPELSDGGVTTGKEGVYVIGAIVALLARGEFLGPEGVISVLSALADAPGVPQLVATSLAPAPERPEPAELLDRMLAFNLPPQPRLIVGAATTIGCNPERLRNEDCYGIGTQCVGGSASSACLTRIAVADGMGGMAAGDEASQAAIAAFLSAAPPDSLHEDALPDWALELGWSANEAVLARLAGRDGGSTLTGLVFDGARFALVHVGDSRAYLASPGAEEIRLLSRDHSLAAALVASGQLDPAKAATSPDRHQLLRSLGSSRNRQPGYFGEVGSSEGDHRTELLEVGATVLLASDGVWDVVSEQTLRASMARGGQDPQAAAQMLVDAAVAGGAPDNATAVVATRAN